MQGLRCEATLLHAPGYAATPERPAEVPADMGEVVVVCAVVQVQRIGKYVPASFRATSLRDAQLLRPAWPKEPYSLTRARDGFQMIWTDRRNNAGLETLDLPRQPAMHVRWCCQITGGAGR